MSIPVITKEYIPEKVLNLVYEEREIDETELDSLILELNDKAVGFALGYIIYQDIIDSETWTNIIELYISWRLLNDLDYTNVVPELVQDKYQALLDILQKINVTQRSLGKNELTSGGIKTRGIFVYGRGNPISS